MALSQAIYILPVTAIEYVCTGSQDILIIGEGPFVKVFCLFNTRPLCQIKVFESQAIHGIAHFRLSQSLETCRFLCLIWGGRCITFVEFYIGASGISCRQLFLKQYHSEWILDSIFDLTCKDDELKGFFLDARNQLYRFGSSHASSTVEQRNPHIVCKGPPSALYSANMKIWQDHFLLIAVGTVFGGVHLWIADLHEELGHPGKLIAVYSGHEGSVFGISLAHLGTGYDTQTLIASCSDDRTVKLWTAPKDPKHNDYQGFLAASQTGFERSRINDTAIPASASASGHLSRIWKVSIFPGAPVLRLITFGEDATAQVWQVKDCAGSGQFSISKGALLNLHTGKNIWAGTALKRQGHDFPAIATGGADGRITVSDLGKCQQHRVQMTTSLSNNDARGDISVRAYCWLDRETLIAVDHHGGVHVGQGKAISEAFYLSWELVTNISGLAKYALVKAVGHDYALLADHNGSLYLFGRAEKSVCEILRMQRKIAFLLGTELARSSVSQSTVSFVFQCLGSAEIHMGRLQSKVISDENVEHTIKTISLPRGFVATCGHFVSTSMIAVGSRNGSIALLQFGDVGKTEQHLLALRVHGEDAVTSISIMESDSWLLSTGRDGCFKVHHIQYQDAALHMSTVHSTKLSFGPDIEGAEIVNRQVHVWGFRGTELVLWNHSIQHELFSIDCGGNHRIWSFYHGPVSALAWTRTGKPHIARLEAVSALLQQGSHGREIKALAIRNHADELGLIIATGAEDTCIRLSTYNHRGELKTLHVIPNHTTGLQKLAWSKNGKYLFSAAGKEEFYVWEIQAIPVLQIGVKMVAAAPSVTETKILRIMDFDVIEDMNYSIIMVYSDSSIRLWEFDPTNESFEIVREATYTTCCLTQCKVIGRLLVTAATDGYLTIWSLSDLRQISRKRVHQSSIKCLEIAARDSRTVIATGGDDNALALTVLDASSTAIWCSLVIAKAHASALNALVISSSQVSQIEVVTASNDQCLRRWTFTLHEGGDARTKISVRRKGKFPSSVADPSCMAMIKTQQDIQIVVAGIGVEIWSGKYDVD